MLAMTNRPFAQSLTPQGEEILNVLRRSPDEWLTRSQIAAAVGKKKLNKWDFALLDLLVERELIEAKDVADKTPIGYKVVYRAKAK